MKLEQNVIALTLLLGLIRFPLTPLLLTQEVFAAYSANLYLIQIVVAISSLGLPELAHDWLSNGDNQRPSSLLYETPIVPLILLSSSLSLGAAFLLGLLPPSFLPYTNGLLVFFTISLISILSVLQLVLAAIQRHCSSRLAYFLPQLFRSGLFIVLLLSKRVLSLESLLSYELLFSSLTLCLSFMISFPISLSKQTFPSGLFSCCRSIRQLLSFKPRIFSILKGIHLSSYLSSLTATSAANVDKLVASSFLPPELFLQFATMLVPSNLSSALTSQLIQVKAKQLINIPKATSLSFSQYLFSSIHQLQLWPLVVVSVPILFSALDSFQGSSFLPGQASRFPVDLLFASLVYSLASVTLILNFCLYVFRQHSSIFFDGLLAILCGCAFISVLFYTSSISLSALVFAALRLLSSFLLSLYVARRQVSFPDSSA